MKVLIVVLLFFAVVPRVCHAQRNTILEIQRTLDTLRSTMPVEKLYVHLDKADYLLGDTIWYKVYVMDGTFGTPSAVSGVVYLELLDGDGQLVQRSRQLLVVGSTYGEFVLDHTKVEPGRFTVRAYTRWLQNFGQQYAYERHVQVSGDYLQDWAVNLAPVRQRDTLGRQQVAVEMRLEQLDGKRLDVQPVTVEVLHKGKDIAKKRVVVDGGGHLTMDFELPLRRSVADLEVAIHTDDALKARFPLTAGLPTQKYDVQFLPESGQWVAGMPAVFGVKAINQHGLGIMAKGVILDPANREIAHFACTHRGMGRVDIPAVPVGEYRAKVSFPDGSHAEYALPSLREEGVMLHHDGRSGTAEHIALRINATAAYANPGTLLVGMVRGTLWYGAVLKANENTHALALPRAHFPEGLIHFSVLDGSGRPLATRMVYNTTGKNRLAVNVTTQKTRYGVRDSAAVTVRVTDTEGAPVIGNFSLAVTDDGQYEAGKWEEDINSRYFLASELQGHIEDPGFYFSDHPDAGCALDNLLLTQGWIAYDQTLLSANKPLAYVSEPFFQVAGKVSNAFGKVLPNTGITMLSVGKYPMVVDTLTDGNGRFSFADIPPFDTAGFVIQARNRRGKSFNVGIDLDMDAQPPAWKSGGAGPLPTPWYVNLDTALQQRVLDHREHQRNVLFGEKGGDLRSIMLREVSVTAKRMVKSSKNLNGPGEADQVLDEELLLEQGEKSLLDILQDRIDGFRLGFYPRKNGRPEYMVRDKKARLIFDGMDLEFFYDPETAVTHDDHMQFLRGYLQRYSGSDVLGVEIMYSMRYSSSYNARHLDIGEIMANVGQETVYIEITTRGGQGPFMRKTPGVTHFRPMPFAWPRAFYRPRYAPNVPAPAARDLRSTIHWEPMVITDEQGEAIVSFFTSDRTGSYTIRVEGMDDNGNFGVAKATLLVTQ